MTSVIKGEAMGRGDVGHGNGMSDAPTTIVPTARATMSIFPTIVSARHLARNLLPSSFTRIRFSNAFVTDSSSIRMDS
jgi:hypothetical protein